MLQTRPREIWACFSEVPQTSIFFMSEATEYMIWKWHRAGLGNHLRRYISYVEGDFCRMYFPRKKFNAESQFLAHRMLRDPDWALRWISKVETWSRQFMRASTAILRSRLDRLTDRQLISLLRACLTVHGKQNGYGASISWCADAEKERVTKAIWSELERHMQNVKSKRHIADVFSVLTTPKQESYVSKEERDFLKLGSTISARPQIRKIFAHTATNEILGKVMKVSPHIARAIRRHHLTYCWLDYQYRGPATTLTEYIDRWRELLRSRRSAQALLDKITRDRKTLLRRQSRVARELRLTPRLKKLLFLARQLVYIKGYRKEVIYHGMYGYEPLLREIGKRLGLTLHQLWAMKTSEIAPALLSKKFDVDELNARQRLALAYIDRRRHTILSGTEARRAFSRIRREQLRIKSVRELRGTPACPGVVRGTVRIINIPEDMKKMKPGNIMVAHNTNPNLVPAMKKAAALVSESGGLTCHTAIIARELRIPCVVGVPGADKILKDGDRVVVDATAGIVRKQ